MIAATPLPDQPAAVRWQQALADAVTSPAELLGLLGLAPADLPPELAAAASGFPLRVPRSFVARMRRGDPADPLLRQVLPTAAEMHVTAGFSQDPVGDGTARRMPGLIQKYSGRALVIATGACGVHCRYCFRRHFPYADEAASSGGWRSVLDVLATAPDIHEVILSGGDPLSLSDRRLAQLSSGLEAIPHIRCLRLHTRQPIVLPERIDAGFTAWLSGVRLRKVVVLHANHANEIDAAVREACRRLAASGATLLNQSVLLKGVNDQVQALANLSEALSAAGVLPYYLHQLDRVQGAAHFEVDDRTACELVRGIAALLPGYLVPRLVREIPGMPAKTPVTY